jgi:hypothetical protein
MIIDQESIKMNTPKEALAVLSKVFADDPAYAWSWHCNIAMCSVDEGMERVAANRAASRFMKAAFGIDTIEMVKNGGPK